VKLQCYIPYLKYITSIYSANKEMLTNKIFIVPLLVGEMHSRSLSKLKYLDINELYIK